MTCHSTALHANHAVQRSEPEPKSSFNLAAGLAKPLVRHRRSFETNSPGRARSNKKRRCLIPVLEEVPEVESEASISTTAISSLPSDILVKIFGMLDPKLQRFVLPLVCRQWYAPLPLPFQTPLVVYTLTSGHRNINSSGQRYIVLCRHDTLAKPLGLWNHLDIDFMAEAGAEEIVPGSNTKNANKAGLLPSLLELLHPDKSQFFAGNVYHACTATR